ncbi:hypothetical protein [Actinoplanes sp. G11-F43]|uniref:hypothetical protein n=1 Tax=Actinoplanes sp. G11-F43 TaxID=3424130 RepID=UPI003D340DE6
MVVAPVLLVLYLLFLAGVGAAVNGGRITLELEAVLYSWLPAVAFAVPSWTGHRWRRCTEPEARYELFRRVVAELVIGLVLLASCVVHVIAAPGLYFTVL